MKKILLYIISLSSLFCADVTLEVIKKVKDLPSIAVEDSSYNNNNIVKKFYKTLIKDLEVLSHFKVKDNYLTQDYDSTNVSVKNKSLDYVIRFRLKTNNLPSITCDFKLLSPNKKRILFEKSYKIKKEEQFVFLAHQIASDINDYLGAPSVEWIKKYIIFSKYVKPKKTEIVIADYSLSYQKTILKNGFFVFPKWADQKQESFYYTNNSKRIPTIYKVNLYTGKQKKLLSSDGMIVVSDLSKDGNKLLLTMSPNNQPDIYLYKLKSKSLEKITNYSGIDVSANFIENEERITFISDRLGYPNIFAKDLKGKGGVEQLVYYGKSNISSDAYKNYIVFSSRESKREFSANTFNIHLISTKTDYVRRLSQVGINQFPRFSPDGESIVFIKSYKRQSSIGLIRLKYNKSFIFPLKIGKIQSLDW